MPKSTRTVDVSANGTTTQVSLLVDKNAQNEEAIGRALVVSGALVDNTNPLPIVDANLGTVSDVTATSDSGGFSVISLIKRILGKLPALVSGRIPVDGSGVTQPISGNLVIQDSVTAANKLAVNASGQIGISNFPATQPISGSVSVSNFPATQPVSLASLPALASGTNAIGSITNTGFAATQSGTWNITNISGTVSLPTGAATSAKQPSLGVAGTPSVDVITVQGSATGTPQPVSGTLTVSNAFSLDVTSIAIRDRLPSALVDGKLPVDVVFPTTQGVSATALPLPTGAATSAKQATPGIAGTASADVLSVQGVSSMTPLKIDGSAVVQPVSGSVSVGNFPATQPVSIADLPLPTGASTAAKQPAFGVSGTPSLDVLTVQGSATMTPFKVDGSSVTQPVSGTVAVSNTFATELTASSIASRLPATIGVKTAATSLAVTLATDGAFATAFGKADDVAAIADTSDTGFISLVKRLLGKFPAALSNGRFVVDSVVRSASTSLLQSNSIGTSAGVNIKNSAGSVYSVSCLNSNASSRYLQLFNKATAPATNDIPLESFIVFGGGGQLILGQDYFTLNGLDFSAGITWGISTTPNTYTAATASETILTIRYL